MTKICPKCNFENIENDSFCQNCGTDLVGNANKKAFSVKQEQDPAIRKIISLILIATTLLCLITCIQYMIGRQPLVVLNKPSETVSISFASNWEIWGTFFDNLIDFDFTNTDTVYLVCRILCHISGSIFYLLLTAFLGFTTYMVYAKSEKAKLFSIISGISGLGVIILGFILGYFLVVTGDPSGRLYSHALPQLTALLLLPLFAQLPILGMMLPQNKKREKKQNNA